MVLSLERWQNKVAVVTGASSGIGESIAKSLVEQGLKVVGFARREERLKQLSKTLEKKKGKFYYVKVDVTKEDEIKAGFKWVTDNVGPVQILVNNAGLVNKNTLINGDTAKWKQIFDINVLGLNICTREAVSIMLAHKLEGYIIHINSVVGHRTYAHPEVNVYCASKFAVTALRDTWAHEIAAAKANIKVTSLSPGFVLTEIGQADGFDISKIPDTDKALLPQDIADGVLYVLSCSPRVEIKELTIQRPGEIFPS